MSSRLKYHHASVIVIPKPFPNQDDHGRASPAKPGINPTRTGLIENYNKGIYTYQHWMGQTGAIL